MNWSQNFTVKSNARRAARKAGVDPAKVETIVKAGAKLYRFPLTAAAPAKKVTSPKAAKPAKAEPAPRKPPTTPKGKRAHKSLAPSDKTERGLKFTAVAALLRRPGGVSITEVCKATGWLPHSARARISVDVSKLLAKGEEITRRREEGVSHYAIVPSKQMELPAMTTEAA